MRDKIADSDSDNETIINNQYRTSLGMPAPIQKCKQIR